MRFEFLKHILKQPRALRHARELRPVISTTTYSVDEALTSSFTQISDLTLSSVHSIANRPMHFLVRQPLLDSNQRIVGYEWKFHKEFSQKPQPSTDDEQRLLHTLLKIDAPRLFNEHLTFIRLSESALSSELIQQLPNQNVVIVMAAPDPKHSASTLKHVEQLRDWGFQFAYDYTVEPIAPAALLSRMDYIRFSMVAYDALTLSAHVNEFTARDHPPTLIATDVHTFEAAEVSEKLGFTYRQGGYYTRLLPAPPNRLSNNRRMIVELLNLVMSRAEVVVLEERFKREPSLLYKLLRFINSPGCGLMQTIRSVSHAITLLGHEQLYRWLTLLLFTTSEQSSPNPALLKNALIRARLIELLGVHKLPAGQQGGLFITGILSLLDVLLNMPLEHALACLNLPDDVLSALVRNEGPYAPLLSLAISSETSDRAWCAQGAIDCGLTPDIVNAAHVEALLWAQTIAN